MSRYVKDINEHKSIAYGFDHAIGYFFQIYDDRLEETEPESNGLELDLSSRLTRMSNGKMLELMEQYDVEYKHIMAVAADLAF